MEFKEFINSKSTVVVDFYADWCAPCKALSKVLDTLPKEKIMSINVEDYPEITSEYKVTGLPTLVYFKDGQEIKRSIGFQTLNQIEVNL